MSRRLGALSSRLLLFSSVAVVCAGLTAAPAAATDLGRAGGIDYQSQDTLTILPGGHRFAFAVCPSETSLIGAGVAISDPQFGPEAFLNNLGPSTAESAVGIVANSSSTDPASATIFGMCSKIVVEGSARVKELPAGKSLTARVSCPHDLHVTGGGVGLGGDNEDAFVNSYFPFDSGDHNRRPDDGWKVKVHNLTGGDRDIVVEAFCVAKRPTYTTRVDQLAIQNADFKARCRNGGHLLSGGVRVDGRAKGARVHNLRPTDNGSDPDTVPDDLVDVGVANTSGGTRTVTSYAICKS